MEKYKFEVPEGISATEEIILRFGPYEAWYPLSSFLIQAGYKELLGYLPDTNMDGSKEWASIHSEDWKRYLFTRWKEFREEVSAGIEKNKHDELLLKKFICGLLTPFNTYCRTKNWYENPKSILSAEAKALISIYFSPTRFTFDEFIPVWRDMVKKTQKKNTYTSPSEYASALQSTYDEEYNFFDGVDNHTEQIDAFIEFLKFPQCYAGCIAGCLLESGAKLEYIDYQKMCGVNLVDGLTVYQVTSSMEWTKELLLSYKPKKLIDLDKYTKSQEHLATNRETVNEKDIYQDELGKVSFGDIKQLPPVYQSQRAAIILEKAYDANLIDKNFKWCRRRGEFAYFIGQFYHWLFGPGDINWKKMKGWGNPKFLAQENKNFISRKSKISPDRMDIDMIFSSEKSVE